MSKLFFVAAAVSLAIGGALPALAGEAHTTRIEPRPFYGATVTIEEGVRVFRPMPPTKHVIVNPDGATPLSLGFNETTVNERSYNYNYHEHQHSGGGSYGRGSFYPSSRFGHIGVGR